MAFAVLFTAGITAATAQIVVGVSWSNFQEERWKSDEVAIKAQLTKLGATYASSDAGGSSEKQLADVDGLIPAPRANCAKSPAKSFCPAASL